MIQQITTSLRKVVKNFANERKTKYNFVNYLDSFPFREVPERLWVTLSLSDPSQLESERGMCNLRKTPNKKLRIVNRVKIKKGNFFQIALQVMEHPASVFLSMEIFRFMYDCNWLSIIVSWEIQKNGRVRTSVILAGKTRYPSFCYEFVRNSRFGHNIKTSSLKLIWQTLLK